MPSLRTLKQRFVLRGKLAIQLLASRFGYDIVRNPLSWHLAKRDITLVLDVGASVGGFGDSLLSKGYPGKIISFEPLPAAYEQLSGLAGRHLKWKAFNVALGSQEGNAEFHVASNGDSSSLLPMLSQTTEVSASIFIQDKVMVPVRRLDNVFHQHCAPDDKVFLKMDVQGFELEVLKGAEQVLSRVDGLLMELSLTPLYDGAPLMEDLMSYVRSRGFQPVWLFHGYKDSVNQQLLQVDGLFFRTSDSQA